MTVWVPTNALSGDMNGVPSELLDLWHESRISP
jgi:hypothetical protein